MELVTEEKKVSEPSSDGVFDGTVSTPHPSVHELSRFAFLGAYYDYKKMGTRISLIPREGRIRVLCADETRGEMWEGDGDLLVVDGKIVYEGTVTYGTISGKRGHSGKHYLEATEQGLAGYFVEAEDESELSQITVEWVKLVEPRECSSFLDFLKEPEVLAKARRRSLYTPGHRRTNEIDKSDNQGVFLFPTFKGHSGFAVKVPSPDARENTENTRFATCKEFTAQSEAWVCGAPVLPPVFAVSLPQAVCRSIAVVEEYTKAPAWLESTPGTPGFLRNQRLYDDFIKKMQVRNIGGDFKLDNLLLNELDGSLVATDCVYVHPVSRRWTEGRSFMTWEEWEIVQSQSEWETGSMEQCTALWRDKVLSYETRYHTWKETSVKIATDKALADLEALHVANEKEMKDLMKLLNNQTGMKVRNMKYHHDQMRRKKASSMERTTGKSKAEVKFILDEEDAKEVEDLLASEEIRIAQRKLKLQKDHEAIIRGGKASVAAAAYLYD